MDNIFWKDDFHKKSFHMILDKMKQNERFDCYYYSFAYLVAAAGKAKEILEYIDEEGIELDDLMNGIEVFSNSEKSMIRFALHLFNNNLGEIYFHDVVRSLDPDNYRSVLEAIQIRYGRI